MWYVCARVHTNKARMCMIHTLKLLLLKFGPFFLWYFTTSAIVTVVIFLIRSIVYWCVLLLRFGTLCFCFVYLVASLFHSDPTKPLSFSLCLVLLFLLFAVSLRFQVTSFQFLVYMRQMPQYKLHTIDRNVMLPRVNASEWSKSQFIALAMDRDERGSCLCSYTIYVECSSNLLPLDETTITNLAIVLQRLYTYSLVWRWRWRWRLSTYYGRVFALLFRTEFMYNFFGLCCWFVCFCFTIVLFLSRSIVYTHWICVTMMMMVMHAWNTIRPLVFTATSCLWIFSFLFVLFASLSLSPALLVFSH